MNNQETPDNSVPHRRSKHGHADFHSSELAGAMQRVLDYLHGEMTAPERQTFEEQIERYAELATEVREMQTLLAAVQTVCDSGPALAPSSQLRTAVTDRLARTYLESLLPPDSASLPTSNPSVAPPAAPVAAPPCAGLDTAKVKLPVERLPVRAIFRWRFQIVAAAFATVALGMAWLVWPRQESPLVAIAPGDLEEPNSAHRLARLKEPRSGITNKWNGNDNLEPSDQSQEVDTPKNQSVSVHTPESTPTSVESFDTRSSRERSESVGSSSIDYLNSRVVGGDKGKREAGTDDLSGSADDSAAMSGKRSRTVDFYNSNTRQEFTEESERNSIAQDKKIPSKKEFEDAAPRGPGLMPGAGGGFGGQGGGKSGMPHGGTSGLSGPPGGSGRAGMSGMLGGGGKSGLPGGGGMAEMPLNRQLGSQREYDEGRMASARMTRESYRYQRPKDLGNKQGQLQERFSNLESYKSVTESDFLPVDRKTARSTFSIDVDTASYANVRRYLNDGQLPPAESVRIEELVNYFTYDYPPPMDDRPMAVSFEIATCPWQPEHELLRVGLKARELPKRERPGANLVFLIDVSGSMSADNKLPLLKQSLNRMVNELGESDVVSIVTYSDTARMVLDCTNGMEKETINSAINQLHAAGSTNGAAGIQLAYAGAVKHLLPEGTNRVLLATDGDLNVGITNTEQLVALVREHAQQNVFLTVLGFGTGNLKDDKLEQLADNGNGVYAYIDGLREGQRVLVEQLSGTLTTVAKDVKLQIEFNPAEVSAYRLIGYDNRVLLDREFHDDRRDAGDLGAGHMVTALYEIVPVRHRQELAAAADHLKYQTDEAPARRLVENAQKGELLTLQFRYKLPNESESRLYELPFMHAQHRFGEASSDFQFASAVAAFGMLLRQSTHRGQATLNGVEEVAAAALGLDPKGIRAEFVDLVRRAKGKGLD